ncbi:hypothetical protein ACKWTF_012127 [Chironomus riparius]
MYIKIYLIFWVFSSIHILPIKLTQGALKFTFTLPVHRTKNLNLSQMHGHHKNFNDMRMHIKHVLNIHYENSTLDEYISKVFNLQNINPTYVFQMPDGNNRTLTLRKSDFISPIFPNITNINKLTKVNLKPTSSNRQQIKMKSEEILDELRNEKLIFQKNLDGNFDDVDYDDNMKMIVQKNVESEKDFETLLNELNEDLDYEDAKKEKNYLNQSQKKNTKTTTVKDEWSELGLDGWSGLMTKSKDNLPKKDRLKFLKKPQTAFVPFTENVDPLSNKQRKPQKQEVTSNESALEMEEYADQIATILLDNEKVILNKTGRIPNVRWPITTSRDQHRDSDVFIARANNPFGHSTKWKYRK